MHKEGRPEVKTEPGTMTVFVKPERKDSLHHKCRTCKIQFGTRQDLLLHCVEDLTCKRFFCENCGENLQKIASPVWKNQHGENDTNKPQDLGTA